MATKHEKESLGFTYDVFISFRGQDIRYTFIGYLREELSRRGICTFFDDWDLKLGKNISISLSNAIDESRILMVVFSENYASSTWCLDELIQILKCGSGYRKQIVFPIFYHVDPSDIRHQRKSYGEHMVTLEERFGKDSQKVKDWRSALRTACNLPGQHITTSSEKPEIDSIKEIVEKIYKNIDPKPLHAGKDLVGLEPRIKEVMSLLDMESDDVRMLGIHGLGGIGKTELAKALYNKIVQRFDAASFLENVREKSNKNGLEDLQKTLLSEMFEDLPHVLGSTSTGIAKIKNRLIQKKVLLVLDDVDDKDKLEKLAGERDWFGKGSRIIITTRDKDVLIAHEVKDMYEMKELDEQHSLELFCWNAFKQSEPKAGFEQVSLRAAGYAKRLPLALKVIGSDLASEETLDNWESVLKKYHDNRPNEKIHNVLKVSCDRLDPEHRQVFLDIACFFKGERKEYVENILDAKLSIKLLCNKSLLTVEGGSLKMHDLIQDMGRKIVEREATNPGKRSRLWYHRDVIRVLTDDLGNDEIQGIMLDPPQYERVDWSGTAFKKMNCLRILIVRNTYFSCEPKHLPNNLRVLDWENYPSESFPSKFYPEDIIVFNLPRSCLMLSEPFKKFSCLTNMDFSNNQSITEMPDVSQVQNLRELRLENCGNLVEFHESVGILERLAHLSASGCTKLRKFLQTMSLPSLEILDLDTCTSLEQFPEITKEMKKKLKIYMKNTAIQKLPESIGNLIGLACMDMSNSKKLEYLPSSLFRLPKVDVLKIGGCSQLGESFASFLHPLEDNVRPILKTLHFENSGLQDKDLFAILNYFPKLEELIVPQNDFVSIPECIKERVHLTSVDVSNCRNIKKIPECTNLKILKVDYCVCLEEISDLPSTTQKVDARYCPKLTRETSDMLWFQGKKGIAGLEVLMPLKGKSVIPKWFDLVGNEGYPHFWVRGHANFPTFVLALVFHHGRGCSMFMPDEQLELHLFINGRYVPRKGYYTFQIPHNHVLICDLRLLFNHDEWLGLNAFLDRDWNVVQVLYETASSFTIRNWGVFAYEEETNRKNVQFTCPDPKYSHMLSVVPKNNPKKERIKMIQNFLADEVFDIMSGALSAMHESIKDSSAAVAFKELLGIQLETFKEVSRQAKAELESEGSIFEDKNSLLTDYLHHMNSVSEAYECNGRTEEQQQFTSLSLLHKYYCGMTDGLVEARKSFHSLNIIKTRNVVMNRAHKHVEWTIRVLPRALESYIEGVIDGLLEAKLSFPDLNVWAILDLVSIKGGFSMAVVRPLITLRDVDVGEEKRNDPPQQQQQQLVCSIFIEGMMDGLLEAHKSFPSLHIDNTINAALHKTYTVKSSPQGNELTLEMRMYTNGVINGLHEAKISFPDLDMRPILDTVLSRIGIYETPILQFASCILDAITIILQVGEALSSTLNRQKSKEEQQLVRWKIFCDGMTDGLVEARDNNFPLLDIIKTRSIAQNKIRRVQWLFVLPQEETKLYIEGIINGLLEAKLSFPYLDVWATLDRVLSRRGMEGLHERIRPFIRIMDEASTSGYWGIEQIVETIFDSGVLDVLFEAQNSFPSLDIIKISGSVFSALDNGNCIELLSDMNLVLPPTVEMIVYISGVVNGLHEAKLSFPDLDKYAILVSVLSKIGIDETLLLQYASRFRIHYGTMWK